MLFGDEFRQDCAKTLMELRAVFAINVRSLKVYLFESH